MKIGVFTSNQPRHLSLIRELAGIADEVFAIVECNTLFPGKIEDFYKKTPVMQEYFSHVIQAEQEVFGETGFLPENTRPMLLKMGDLNHLKLKVLEPVFSADICVVFGASYIKGHLCEKLIDRGAVNIHMGVSPYYRGSSCNFWALYDKKPEMVGATIHWLGKGLDSGDMLFHAFPNPASVDPFVYGMLSVKAAHKALVGKIVSREIFDMTSIKQDKSKEIRYSRYKDFNDEVAAEYLQNRMTPEELLSTLKNRDQKLFLRPVFV